MNLRSLHLEETVITPFSGLFRKERRMKKLFLLVLLAAFFLGFHSMNPQVIFADQTVTDTSDGDDDVIPIPDPPDDPEDDSDDELIPEIDPEEDDDVMPEDDQDDPDDLLPIE